MQQGKINSAYAIGKTRHWDGGGLILSKAVVEFVSGLQIDHVVSVDFGAFEDVIDAMGGVEITLEEEFAERRQWRRNPEFADTGGEFILPKGRHLLSGQMALFYARSRFSSSDFERGRRIQQIALAVKKKMMELGWLKNPLSILKFIETTEKHIRTNMSFTEIKNLVSEIREYEISKQVILSTAAPAFLVEGTVNNQYILLPPESNFDKIRDIFINLF